MDYVVEVMDRAGRRVGRFTQVPILEAERATPDGTDRIRGLLPGTGTELGVGYRVRVSADGRRQCEAVVTKVEPAWSDLRKLILDQYVHFHEVLAFEAAYTREDLNRRVAYPLVNKRVGAAVKAAVNRTLGPLHYLVDHDGYPDGAEREYAKLVARMTPENELEVGGIAEGQWVGAGRIDASEAYAKDGDTIAGLKVDGAAWPDLRLMLVDCEEMTRNSHAVTRHPEVADWTDERYVRSGYAAAAQRARDALQALMTTHGVTYIELNPHRGADGAFDDRVDAYGRYLGLVYGGGLCFNAAQVETGDADVYLYDDGAYHDPALELKDFYSYAGPAKASIEEIETVVGEFNADGPVFEAVTALAYAGGCVWSVDGGGALHLRRPVRADRVVFHAPWDTAVALGADATQLTNIVYFEGDPRGAAVSATYTRGASIDAFGAQARGLKLFALNKAADAAQVVSGLLDDVAYPALAGSITFVRGDAAIAVGDLVELRDGGVRRFDAPVDGEWGGRFAGALVARVSAVRHRFAGRTVETTAELTSPLRTVERPLTYMVQSQVSESELWQFRLDDAEVGLDMSFYLG